MLLPIKNTTSYFISDDGYCIDARTKKNVIIPLSIKNNIPRVKIQDRRHRLLDLMLEYFFKNVEEHSKYIYKIIDNKMPLEHIKEIKLPKSLSTDEDYIKIVKYNCDVKSHSANKRAPDRISKYDVLDVLKINNFKCFYCGDSIKNKNWHLDHVMPLSNGGKNIKTNITSSCKWCNIMKSNLSASDFLTRCSRIIEHNKDSIFLNRKFN